MPIKILDNFGEEYIIKNLTLEDCKLNQLRILELINNIPYINWTVPELFDDKDFFGNKWKYSLIITNNQNEIVGVIIAYFRLSDDKHIVDSLYIHKLSISEKYQKRGLGTSLINAFLYNSYESISWLNNVTVQTNDEIPNDFVINFYKKLGFNRLYNIIYPEKNDILMIFTRASYNELKINNKHQTYKVENIRLTHPRLNHTISKFANYDKIPVLYFSTSNNKKKELYQFIFNNYNLKLIFVSPKIRLTEPQVESAELIEEQNLVQFPLKLLSRFITNTPFVVEDTMLFLEYFNRTSNKWELPGHDTKRWWKQLGAEGILKIIGKSKKRNARFVSQMGAYVKSNEYFFGRGEVNGTISIEPKVMKDTMPKLGTYPYFFHSIFIPDGASKTLAEMDMYEYSKYDYKRKCILNFIENLRYTDSPNDQLTLFE